MSLLRRATGTAKRPQTSRPVLEVNGVSVKYLQGSNRDDIQSLVYKTLLRREKPSESWALKDVSLTGHCGEIIGIIGPNGAGKTTLCKLIAGLLRPDKGSVRVDGDVMALLTLGAGFNQELSGRENIILNGLMLGLSKERILKLMPEITAFAGLERFIEQPIKTYSTGMRARLGFSIAATMEPEVLIVDEALSVGDAEFSERAAARMRQLVESAKLVVVVTHQLEFVEKHCTKAVWMDKGTIRAVGSPAEVVPPYRATVPQPPAKVHRPVSLQVTKGNVRPEAMVVAHRVGVKYRLPAKGAGGNGILHRPEEFWPLREVSFAVYKGDILGVIGRNGAGKSTLCKLLTGILSPDTGTLAVNGETCALLTVGTGFNDQLPGRENIFLHGMMLGLSRARLHDLYGEIVEFAGLGCAIDKPVKQYSRGMKARLGFSVAATIQPDILVVDEALAVGDLSFYEKASAKMQELMSKAKAVVVVTHDLSFVEKVCTRALWIEGGTVAFDGDPREAVAAYLRSGKR